MRPGRTGLLLLVLLLLVGAAAERAALAGRLPRGKGVRRSYSGVYRLSSGEIRRLSAEYRRDVVAGHQTQRQFLEERGLSTGDLRILRHIGGTIDGQPAFPLIGRSRRPVGGGARARERRLVPVSQHLTGGPVAKTLSPRTMAAARALFGRYQRGELAEVDLAGALHRLGVTHANVYTKLKPSGDPAFESRADFLARHHDAMVDAVLDVARRNRTSARGLRELFEVVNGTDAVVARFGRIASSRLLASDRRRGDRLRLTLQRELGFTDRLRAPRGAAAPRAGGSVQHRGPNRGRADSFSARYVARLTMLIHEAGPDADFDDIVDKLRDTPEFREDGRTPTRGTLFGFEQAKTYPGLIGVWKHRKTFQKSRILVEAIRTAPAGTSLRAIVARHLPVTLSYPGAKKMLAALTPARARELGLDPAAVARIRRGHGAGLGEAPDPSFDPTLEPPDVDLDLVRDVLAMPRPRPTMRHFLDRLGGRKPFAGHKVLFVYHQYSDMVPLAETFMAAGMSASSTLFVKTAYPFNDSVRRNLDYLGIRTLEHEQSVPALRASIEQGIRELLARGGADPILIVDDGGMASAVIAEKFRGDIHRFKIFEITEAGHRLADQFKRTFHRMPIVYGSKARLAMKKRVTSPFHARRVVDRLLALLPQTGVELPRPKMTVIGGGAMGLPAYRELVKRMAGRGIAVSMVEKDARVAKQLRRRGVVVEDLESALATSGLLLGMTGGTTNAELGVEAILGPEHLDRIADGMIFAQGGSKRNEFAMEGFEARAESKARLPRTDGLPQASFTYTFQFQRDGGGKAGKKRLHFLGDGWALNHDGSLHGTRIEDLDLELALVLEGAAMVADARLGRTGQFLQVSRDVQEDYHRFWTAHRGDD